MRQREVIKYQDIVHLRPLANASEPKHFFEMAEAEWISAAEALKRVCDATDRYAAPRAICSRAHVGLITAKAARFVVKGQAFDDYDIPNEFWWARGEAALEQNWQAGDFETWIDKRIHLEAFGVSFSLKGIE